MNLILTGAAVSNVFDGVISLDSGGDNNGGVSLLGSSFAV